MTLIEKLRLESTESLRTRLEKSDTITTYEREKIIRVLNERGPKADKPAQVQQRLLDSQMEWIESL